MTAGVGKGNAVVAADGAGRAPSREKTLSGSWLERGRALKHSTAVWGEASGAEGVYSCSHSRVGAEGGKTERGPRRGEKLAR
jgi:hypothetical protein